MKCTSCGNTNLVKTSFPVDSHHVSRQVEAYLCIECGHYEFYSQEKAKAYHATVAIIKDMEQELENLRNELEILQSPTTIQTINDDIQAIEMQLNSLDITIRQQQQLKAKHSELNRRLSVLPSKISRKTNHINAMESKLSTIKSNLASGCELSENELREARHVLFGM